MSPKAASPNRRMNPRLSAAPARNRIERSTSRSTSTLPAPLGSVDVYVRFIVPPSDTRPPDTPRSPNDFPTFTPNDVALRSTMSPNLSELYDPPMETSTGSPGMYREIL